jgi:hypothetical protein
VSHVIRQGFSGATDYYRRIAVPEKPDIFTKIQWYAFQATLLILFLIGLFKILKAAW